MTTSLYPSKATGQFHSGHTLACHPIGACTTMYTLDHPVLDTHKNGNFGHISSSLLTLELEFYELGLFTRGYSTLQNQEWLSRDDLRLICLPSHKIPNFYALLKTLPWSPNCSQLSTHNQQGSLFCTHSLIFALHIFQSIRQLVQDRPCLSLLFVSFSHFCSPFFLQNP